MTSRGSILDCRDDRTGIAPWAFADLAVPDTELPAGALPEIDWIHLFPCRYGDAVPGSRRSNIAGRAH